MILAVINAKGRAAKTTTAVNLADMIASRSEEDIANAVAARLSG
jgi:cellulose biosynthesis protein BcsQ